MRPMDGNPLSVMNIGAMVVTRSNEMIRGLVRVTKSARKDGGDTFGVADIAGLDTCSSRRKKRPELALGSGEETERLDPLSSSNQQGRFPSESLVPTIHHPFALFTE